MQQEIRGQCRNAVLCKVRKSMQSLPAKRGAAGEVSFVAEIFCIDAL